MKRPPGRESGLSVGRHTAVGSATLRPDGEVDEAPDEAPAGSSLLDEAVQTALESIQVLERHAHELAVGFRSNRAAEANRGLVDLMQSTQTMLVLASVAAGVAGLDLPTLVVRGPENADEDTRLAIHRLIECEEAQDWPALADTIDRELVPAFAQWRSVFESLSGRGPEPPKAAA